MIFVLAIFYFDSKPSYQNCDDLYQIAHPNIQTEYYFSLYGKQYNVPPEITRGILRLETGYTGINKKYNPYQTSSAHAYGPGQIQLPTAQYVQKDGTITKEELLYDIKLNALICNKYISDLHARYGTWEKALSYYNSGRPIVNGYARTITARLN